MTSGFVQLVGNSFAKTLEISLHASLIIGVLLVIRPVIKRFLPPRWVYALWFIVVARLLLVEVPSLPATASASLQSSLAVAQSINLEDSLPHAGLYSDALSAPETVAPDASIRSPGAPVPSAMTWPETLAVIWLAGMAALLFRFGLGSFRWSRRLARAPTVETPEICRILEECREEMGVRPVRLVELDGFASPSMTGLIYPTIILPENFLERFSPEELRWIFLHELAHLKRWDLPVQLICQVLQAIHWFNPLVWAAFACFRCDREVACDADVLEQQASKTPRDYGHTLIKVAETYPRSFLAPGFLGISEEKTDLQERVEKISKHRRPALGWIVSGAVLCALLALVFLTRQAGHTSTVPTPLAALAITPTSSDESGFELTVEMRNGSRVIGKALDDTLSFHSATLGDMKLPWSGISSIEYAADTDTTHLTTADGDGFTVQISSDTLRLETGFGKTELPVKLISSIKVSPAKPDAANEPGQQLTIELWDGSRLFGEGLDDTLNFQTKAVGGLKLKWAGIRSIVYAASDADSAQLTATNGDVYEVQFISPEINVETNFGKNELPVKLIRSITVSPMIKPGELPAGLVAFWSGDGNANDSVGGNNGKLVGNVTYGKGRNGKAFVFDGTKDWVDVGNPVQFQLQDFTITAWAKRESTAFVTDNNPRCIIFGYPLGGYGFGLDSTGHLGLAKSGKYHMYSDAEIIDTKWHQLAVTKSGSAVVIYLDGNAYPAPAFDQKFDFWTSASIGGKGEHGSEDTFAGSIEEVGLYNRALSYSEVQEIYSEQNDGEPPPVKAPPVPPAETDLGPAPPESTGQADESRPAPLNK